MITCSYNNDDGDEVVPGLDKVDEAKKSVTAGGAD
jgi:hypothetical protein